MVIINSQKQPVCIVRKLSVPARQIHHPTELVNKAEVLTCAISFKLVLTRGCNLVHITEIYFYFSLPRNGKEMTP